MVQSKRRPRLTFTLLANLADHVPVEHLLAVGVGPHETIAALLSDQRGNGAQGRVARAVVIEDGIDRGLDLEPADMFGGAVPQPLPDGGLLLVEAIQRGQSPNASVYDAEGRLSRRFIVGDGVQQVLVDAAGLAWVSYFDEGVVGGDAISQSGLNRFDPTSGQRTWTFSPGAEMEPILDCYALNVAGREAWAYYYTPFDLVHVKRDGQLERWTTTVFGARGVAISAAGVLLVGYDGRWRASLWQLGEGRLERSVEVDVQPPDRDSPGETPALVSRGARIYAVYRDACYVGSVET
jgi:hypothetical protein